MEKKIDSNPYVVKQSASKNFSAESIPALFRRLLELLPALWPPITEADTEERKREYKALLNELNRVLARIDRLDSEIRIDAERHGMGDIVPTLPLMPTPGLPLLKEKRAEYQAAIAAYSQSLDTFRRRLRACFAATSAPAAHDQAARPAEEAGMEEGDVLVTLAEAALVARIPKRTLEKKPLPKPDKSGGHGRAHRWRWRRLLPTLELYATKQLPRRFPTFS